MDERQDVRRRRRHAGSDGGGEGGARRPPGKAIDHVVVVVPAADEARRIGAALDALELARGRLPPAVTSGLVVVADGCTDATYSIARLRLLSPPDAVLEVALGSAGAARRHGVAHALAHLPAPLERTWIASTDADSRVPPDWLLRHLDIARRGWPAVAGVVELDGETDPAFLARFQRHYRLPTTGSHPHVHAANLGVRADAYRAAGGWDERPTGEEHDLWRRLRRAGHAPLACGELRVATSARRRGRAPAGFAADLAALDRLDRLDARNASRRGVA